MAAIQNVVYGTGKDQPPKRAGFFMLHFMTSVSAFQDVAMYSYNLPNLTEGYPG
jgi:hypothetical protein